MCNRLCKFLVEKDILYQKKSGFQSAHSAEHSIIQLLNRITDTFTRGKYTLRILIDIFKAFDTVTHTTSY